MSTTSADRRMAPFLTIWVGQQISLLGSQLVQFALIWYLTTTTGSATMLAIASAVGILPNVVLGPFAGALVDRWSRRVVMFASDSVVALATAALAVLFALGLIQPWHILAMLFVRSIGQTFQWPAMAASTSLMVPEENLTRVAGMNQSVQGLLMIVAAPLGALLLSLLPMQGILAIDFTTALFSVVPLLFIAVPSPVIETLEGAATGLRRLFNDVGAGLHYLWGWPGMLMLLIVATLINMVAAPAFALLPLLVTGVFNGGAGQLALLETVMGIGMIVGGIALSAWGGFERRIYTTLMGMAGMSIGAFLYGFAPASMFWVMIAGSAVTGVMLPITNGPLLAILQARVDPAMQGRVMTLSGSIAPAASLLSLAAAGPLADAVGVQMWFLISGVVVAVLAAGSLLATPIRRIEDRSDAPEEELIAASGVEEASAPAM